MSSLTEARQIYQELQRVDKLVDRVSTRASDANRILSATMRLADELGLPRNIEQAMRQIMRLIAMARTLQASIVALQTAMIPGAGPLATIAALVGVGASIMSMQMELEVPRY